MWLTPQRWKAGINSANVLHCLWGSVSVTGHQLDGVAVVSDIMAAVDPLAAARRLAAPIRAFYASPRRTFSQGPAPIAPYTVDGIKSAVGAILQVVRRCLFPCCEIVVSRRLAPAR